MRIKELHEFATSARELYELFYDKRKHLIGLFILSLVYAWFISSPFVNFIENDRGFVIHYHQILWPYLEELIKLLCALPLLWVSYKLGESSWISYASIGIFTGFSFGVVETVLWPNLTLLLLLVRMLISVSMHTSCTMIILMVIYLYRNEHIYLRILFPLQSFVYVGTLHLFFNGFMKSEEWTFIPKSSTAEGLVWMIVVYSALGIFLAIRHSEIKVNADGGT